MNPQVFLPVGSLAAAALPRPLAEALAAWAARIAAPWTAATRRTARANLARALQREIPDATCRAIERTYARYYLGVMRLAHRNPESAIGSIRVSGVEHIEDTLRRGRGAVALGAHVGNWDASAIAMAQHFGQMHAFVEALRPAALLRFYSRARARHGVHVLCAGQSGSTAMRVLRDNKILGMLVDRPFGSRCERTTFGGAQLDVPSGGIWLGQRAGAGIHAVFALASANGFDVQVSRDLAADLRATDERERVGEVAQRFATQLHAVVAAHPDQWCALHPLTSERGRVRNVGRRSRDPRAAPARGAA